MQDRLERHPSNGDRVTLVAPVVVLKEKQILVHPEFACQHAAFELLVITAEIIYVSFLKKTFALAVVVAQLVQRLLPTSEVHGSKPNNGKI